MGCYDSVWVRCPGCGEKVEFQSKAGACLLRSYDPSSVPPEIATDLDGDVSECRCGARVRLRLDQPNLRVRMTAYFDDEAEDEYD